MFFVLRRGKKMLWKFTMCSPCLLDYFTNLSQRIWRVSENWQEHTFITCTNQWQPSLHCTNCMQKIPPVIFCKTVFGLSTVFGLQSLGKGSPTSTAFSTLVKSTHVDCVLCSFHWKTLTFKCYLGLATPAKQGCVVVTRENISNMIILA